MRKQLAIYNHEYNPEFAASSTEGTVDNTEKNVAELV
jgi:hypothetical protein